MYGDIEATEGEDVVHYLLFRVPLERWRISVGILYLTFLLSKPVCGIEELWLTPSCLGAGHLPP